VVRLRHELGDASDRTEVPVNLADRFTGPSLERVQVEQRAGRQRAEERRALGEHSRHVAARRDTTPHAWLHPV
jgi:hypothetical protein